LSVEIIDKVNNWLDKTFSPNGKKIFILFLAIAFSSLIYFCLPALNKKNNVPVEETVIGEIDENPDNGDLTEFEIDEIEAVDDTMVTLNVDESGRANPFLPGAEAIVTRDTRQFGYDLMAPPENLDAPNDASRVMTTKISGILYDTKKPSAILNIEGQDYLVRVGDYINNYKILSITKDLVSVQLGSNVYKARVGEAFTEVPLNYNTVYDLEHRFGGARRR